MRRNLIAAAQAALALLTPAERREANRPFRRTRPRDEFGLTPLRRQRAEEYLRGDRRHQNGRVRRDAKIISGQNVLSGET